MSILESADMAAGQTSSAPPSLVNLIGTLAALMTNGALGTGDLADLRRLDVSAPARPVYWRLMTGWIAADRSLTPSEESRWAVILSGMARVGHNPRQKLGAALAEAEYSEGRLMKLLRTEDANLPPLVRRTCVFLAAKGLDVDWTEFARFILTTDPEKHEAVRRQIARIYYAVKAKKEKQS